MGLINLNIDIWPPNLKRISNQPPAAYIAYVLIPIRQGCLSHFRNAFSSGDWNLMSPAVKYFTNFGERQFVVFKKTISSETAFASMMFWTSKTKPILGILPFDFSHLKPTFRVIAKGRILFQNPIFPMKIF